MFWADIFPWIPSVKQGFDYLFERQVVSFSSAHRKSCYSTIATTIQNAVSAVKQGHKSQVDDKTAPKRVKESKANSIHDTNMDNECLVKAKLVQLVYDKYDSVQHFFNAGSSFIGYCS